MAEFFNMGGYALYVWGSFGAAAVVMIAEPVLLSRRRKAALQSVARLQRMNQESGNQESGYESET
jgi:heme exporter protein D